MFFIPPPTRVDNEHKVFSIAAAIIVIGVVTTILVGARLTYRFWKKNQGLDDYAIIVSLVSIESGSTPRPADCPILNDKIAFREVVDRVPVLLTSTAQ